MPAGLAACKRLRCQIASQTAPPAIRTSAIAAQARPESFTTPVSHGRRSGLSLASFFPQLDIGLQVPHHVSELLERQRLRAVADGLFGVRMHFHDQAIGADGDARSRNRRDQAALAGGMAGIEN